MNNGIVPGGQIYVNREKPPGDAAVTAALRAWAAHKKKGKRREMILDGDEESTEESEDASDDE